jgi:hypothetical protein
MAKCLEKYRDIKLQQFISSLENPTVSVFGVFCIITIMSFIVRTVKIHDETLEASVLSLANGKRPRRVAS